MPVFLSPQRSISGLGLLAAAAGLPVILTQFGPMPGLWLLVYGALIIAGLVIVWRDPATDNYPGLLFGGALLAALILEMVWEAAIDSAGFDQWMLIAAAKTFTWLTVLTAIGIELFRSWRRGFWQTPIGRDLLLILGVGIAIRLLTAVSWRFHAETDAAGYVMLAQSFVDLSLQSNMQYPFYQWLLAFVLRSTQYLGPWAEVVHLSFFLSLSLLVPITSYDILRRARGRGVALAGGLLAAVALPQIAWAHHTMTEETALVMMMLALWGISMILDPTFTRHNAAFALSGSALGILSLIRPPMLLIFPIYSLIILLTPYLRRYWRRGLIMAAIPFSVIVGGWTLLIHYPTTHLLPPSPYSGSNLLLSAVIKGMPVTADNGPVSAELIRLSTIHTFIDDAGHIDDETFFSMLLVPSQSGRPEDYEWYTSQEPPADANLTTLNGFPMAEWMYYIGAKEADDMMMEAFQETIKGRTGYYALGILIDLFRLYDPTWNTTLFPDWYPLESTVTWGEPGVLGWQRATLQTLTMDLQDDWLWRPGVRLLSVIDPIYRYMPAGFFYLIVGWALFLSHVWPTRSPEAWQFRQPILWVGLILFSSLLWAALTGPQMRYHSVTDPIWFLCLVWVGADIVTVILRAGQRLTPQRRRAWQRLARQRRLAWQRQRGRAMVRKSGD